MFFGKNLIKSLDNKKLIKENIFKLNLEFESQLIE
jgi:hypothetical protein